MSTSYYEPQGWQAPARQASWEQPVPPSRSGTSSVSQRDDSSAFSSQFDEVDRAIDNLVKSGKLFNGPRRESMPMMMMGRHFPEYDPRMAAGSMPPQRHHSVSDFEQTRGHPGSALQGFYASQRFQGRQSETEQMLQAKRRMAAQRERELRNYHQEQQYNRSLLAEMSGNKSDRSLSPAAMSEESRRELIARQHRALYGNESPAFFAPGSLGEDAHSSRADNTNSGTPTSVSGGVRGPSPRAVDPFGMGQSQPEGPNPATGRQSPRANSTTSPNTGANSYGLYENVNVEQPNTSNSSPGGADSPSSRQLSSKSAGHLGSVGPIGSRPSQPATSQAQNPALNKRSTTPLPSPLGFGFAPNESANTANERSNSSASNPTNSGHGTKESAFSSGWGGNSGVWGKNLGVQASVWG
ncbi:hypothetical protein TMatcc_002641 [Talaromyces marneffei ATCC 18224]|uniref:Uncharacterized protein n=2 Tax=Talaromyces marneffei TaxID=37727 RepID=B6Q2C9_TALMQ|nr:uncharacterized protein EYB26_002255 [Talaromyces marneffei]EEA29000.1 conserved hypothetical protein [Talaromyces marneffei ATCC 18224]KAE8555403.1 hypothetical protein EYB25_000098 [Talaromyces marneffei]QGA14599.1 hypothetical protein EYB26_002255 [Talaromyces marneffei]